MSTTTRTTTRRSARRSALRVLPLAAVAALAAAQPAAALPTGGGGLGDPPNLPPVPRFTISPNPALVSPQLTIAAKPKLIGGVDVQTRFGDTVKFDASASTDVGGTIAKYQWDLDGNGAYDATGKTTTKRYANTGSFVVKLRVTDDDGAVRTLTHTVKIHQPPKAALTATAPTVLVGQQVGLSAKTSTDDNGIAKYEWDLDGNGSYETATGQNPESSTSFTTLGTHSASVRVTDVYGAASTASVKVLVHRAPTASFTAAPSPAVVGETVTFDGSASSDDAPIAKYEWDLDGDGTYETTSTGPQTTKAYTTTGARTIRLRVTDDHGVEDVVAHALQVDAAPAPDRVAPMVRITPRSVKLSRTGTVSLKVTCPATERSCGGRLALRTKGARSSAVGGKAFRLGGGQTATLKVKVSRKTRKAVARRHRLATGATAVATDAAGNVGTTKTTVTIKKR